MGREALGRGWDTFSCHVDYPHFRLTHCSVIFKIKKPEEPSSAKMFVRSSAGHRRIVQDRDAKARTWLAIQAEVFLQSWRASFCGKTVEILQVNTVKIHQNFSFGTLWW